MLPLEVLANIFLYLPYKDLLATRLVCKKWKNANSIFTFPAITKLTLSERNYKYFIDFLKNNSSGIHIHNLDLKYFNCNRDDLKFIMNIIGQHIRCLILPNEFAYTELYVNCFNLRHLNLNITYNNNSIVQSISDVFNLKQFPKLNSIELNCTEYCNKIFSVVKYSYLELLENVSNSKLQYFSINFIDEEIEPRLLRFLESNATTIKYIHLTFLETPMKESTFTWCEVFKQFVNLNTIKLGGKCSAKWLYAIFNNLPKIANISHIDLSGLVEVNTTLLMEIINKWPKTLQYLELMFCIHIRGENLSSLQLTKNNLLVLNVAYCSHITSKDLLGAIDADNRHLRELYLPDLQKIDGECICILAKRLPNLEVLHLDNCRAVTDKVLAYIFHFLKRLKCLVLNDCQNITDDGLVTLNVFSDSLQSLQRLQTLGLQNCRNLTNRTLINLKLPNLLNLNICYCYRISTVGIKCLTTNCPTIETLLISSCPKLIDESILFVCQQLPHLTCLNISNCTNLTELTIEHIVTHCDSLKDLIACGFFSWNFNNVYSKLKLKPKIHLINT